jgi:hypothetical protein
MVNVIYNIPRANDGEQYKDNNITKYLELNKDILLDLSEKHYENLVEALTNNAIGSASYSNSTLPLSSSSTFVDVHKSDPYRIEESEDFHNSKGDIPG